MIWEWLSSVGNDILPYPMPYFAGVYGNRNGNRRTLPLRPQQLLKRRVVGEALHEGRIAVHPQIGLPLANRLAQELNSDFRLAQIRRD